MFLSRYLIYAYYLPTRFTALVTSIFNVLCKLNIGSGTQKFEEEGWINIDIYQYPEVDIVRDVEKGLPFDDESVEKIYTSHFLEHVKDLNFVMEECHRVLKKGGVMHIIVPFFRRIEAYRDPTHIRFFTDQTFLYFTQPIATDWHFRTKCNFAIVSQELNKFELWVKLEKQ